MHLYAKQVKIMRESSLFFIKDYSVAVIPDVDTFVERRMRCGVKPSRERHIREYCRCAMGNLAPGRNISARIMVV